MRWPVSSTPTKSIPARSFSFLATPARARHLAKECRGGGALQTVQIGHTLERHVGDHIAGEEDEIGRQLCTNVTQRVRRARIIRNHE